MLNILTIITIGWSFMMLISSIVNAFVFSGKLVEIQEKLAETREAPQVIDQPFINTILDVADTVLAHAEFLNLNSILVYLLSILGAFLMRKFMKLGFWMYVLATAIEISVPIIVLQNSLAAGAFMIGGFFSLVFVVLYAVNYKELNDSN